MLRTTRWFTTSPWAFAKMITVSRPSTRVSVPFSMRWQVWDVTSGDLVYEGTKSQVASKGLKCPLGKKEERGR